MSPDADLPPRWLPSTERVIQLHEAGLVEHGGGRGGPTAGCVEGAIGNALLASRYITETSEPDPCLVAAYALFYLARNHCFTDGNKRVAWMTAVDILLACRLGVQAEDAAVVAMVLSVADGTMGQKEVHNWFLVHLTAEFD